MKDLKEAKRIYDETPIPEELDRVVAEAIRNSKARRHTEPKGRGVRYYRWGAGVVAAMFVVLTLGVNINTVFAEEAAKLPIIGKLAKVLTIKSYVQKDEDMTISVDIPSIEVIAEENQQFTEKINREIYDKCNAYAEEAIKRAEEYKAAFMDTGGTLEEWAAHKIEIKVSYEIKSQTDTFLSFAVRGTESWTTAYATTEYYNLDLNSNRAVTLEDLLGENYKQRVNESIKEQISTRSEVGFFPAEEGGFQTIGDAPQFYINERNNPVIVFGKYEIAPGSAGEVEFEITK